MNYWFIYLKGQGSFDYIKVYLAKNKNNNNVYAVKIIDLDNCELNIDIIKVSGSLL